MQRFRPPSQVCVSVAPFDGAVYFQSWSWPAKQLQVCKAFSASEKQIVENSSPAHISFIYI